MTRGLVALVAVGVVGLAGCSGPDGQVPPPASSSVVEGAAAPEDRDERAVLAALARLDLCAVLDRAAVATPGIPDTAKPVADQPSRCYLGGLPNRVEATVVGMPHDTRLRLPTRALGGAKAYVDTDATTCDIYLPVSFEKAIRFSQDGVSSEESCRVTTDLVTASATVLADPDAVRVAARWNACDAFAQALGAAADGTKLIGDGLDDCTDYAHTSHRASVSFAAVRNETGKPQEATIGGTRAQVYPDEAGGCAVYWRQGPFESRYAAAPDYQVGLTMADCDQTKDVAAALMRVLDEAPPDDVTPQAPLLYPPNEPDGPYPGACAYVDGADLDECEPYTRTRVPRDIVKGVSSDPNVVCAVAAVAVGSRFGAGLRPAAVRGAPVSCYFVEPQRRLQVRFTIRGGRTTGDPGSTAVTVAGHPGYVTSTPTLVEYTLSTTSTVEGDGTLALRVTTGPVLAEDTPLPTGSDQKARSVITDVLLAHFS